MNLITAIKLLFQVKNPATDIINDLKGIKSGWKTITWWASFFLALGTLAATLSHFIPPIPGLIATTVLTLIYSVLRMAQTAGQPGVQPAIFLSTKFWMGVLGLTSTALISLKTGGVDAPWIVSSLSVIGTVMAAAQNVAGTTPANVPDSATPPTPTPTK